MSLADDARLELRVMQHRSALGAGMLLAITRWPTILTPEEVCAEADADWQRTFAAQVSVAPWVFPRNLWIELVVRGYAWQSGLLLEMWGIDNSKLRQELMS